MTHYTKLKQDAELEKYLKKLIRYEGGLYDPESKKKLFIIDGCCIKGECLYSTSKGKLKVLLPESLRSDFQREIPLERIGKIVVCIAHFFFVDQLFYIKNGFFPESVRLMRKGENNHKIETEIPTPPLHDGFKASLRAIDKDEDWEIHLDKLPDTALVCAATASRSSSPTPSSRSSSQATSPQPNSLRQKKYRKALSANDKFTQNLSFAQLPSNLASPVSGPSGLQATVSYTIPTPDSTIRKATGKRPFGQLASSPVSRIVKAKTQRMPDDEEKSSDNDEEESRDKKEIQRLKQKLKDEQKKNEVSFQNEMLKKEIEEKDKVIKERDETIEERDKIIEERDKRIEKDAKAIEEKDILISKLSTCAYKCIKHKEDFKKGSTYPQLGYGSSKEDLKNKIVKRVESLEIDRQQIFFQEIEHVEEKNIKFQCKPDAEKIVFDASKYKLVVIYKKNHFSQCRDHQFMVVCFIALDILDMKAATSLRKYFVNKILPKCKGQIRECNSIKRPRKKLQTEDPKSKDSTKCKKSKETGKALKKTTEAESIEEEALSCKCQGEKEDEKGFSLTIGCTKDSKGGKCRFSHKYHPEQPTKRYPLNNYENWEEENKTKFIKTVKSLGIKMTKVLEKFAPEAHKNMSKTKPTRCNLAQESVFCAMTMVSDFTAHQHTDKNDVRDGATALLTLLKNDEGEGQYHCLPRYKIKGSTSKQIGVSFLLPHGSVLIEVAALEYHSSTPVPIPNGQDPQRLGLVFFSHKGLDKENHGFTSSKDEEREPQTASESD
jgi:hypothetical protein